MKYTLLTILLFFNICNAQSLVFLNEIGKFQNAISFDVDLTGNIYITDIIEHNLIKLDSTGKELVSIGGYGWSEASFDEPVSVITNTLSVYVADKNNDRVQRFDKDLNFLSLYNGRSNNSNIQFAYPIAVEISNIGDLYILETDNNRILKFNLTGEYLTEIGGNDAGVFALNNPKDFKIDNFGNLFVLDENLIKVFDQYGNGQYTIALKILPNKIDIYNTKLILIEDSSVIIFDAKERKILNRLENLENLNGRSIIDAKCVNNLLYVLSPNTIIKYKIY